MSEWKKVKIGEFLTESKVLAEESDAAHRITVRLNCKGVEKRGLKAEKEGATKYYTRYTGQFIYGKQNIHKGAFGIIPSELDGFTSSADLPAFDIDESKCVPEWIPLCLKVDERYKTLQKEVKGVGSQRLAVNVFLNVEIPLPEVSVQRKILAKVGKKITSIALLDDEIEKQKSYAKQLRQNILQDAIEGKLTEDWRKKHPLKKGDPDYDAEALFEQIQNEKYHTDLFAPNSAHVKKAKSVSSEPIRVTKKDKSLPPITKDEIPFEIPTGWKWVRLGEICEKITDGTHKTPKYTNSGVKFVSAKDIYNKELDFSHCKYISENEHRELYKRCNPEYNDLLISKSGSIGTVALNNVKYEFSLFESLALVKYNQKLMLPKFMQYAVQCICNNLTASDIKGICVKHLHLNVLSSQILSVPPLAEQKEIVARVEKHLQTITQLEIQIASREATTKQLMQSILKDAFEKG